MNPIRIVAGIIAVIALLICIWAPFRVFFGLPTDDYQRNFEIYLTWFNWATLLWFISAPIWMVPEIFRKEKK